MDVASDGVLYGSIDAALHNVASLVTGEISDAALCLDGIDQAASLGEHRSECFGDLRECVDGITVSFWIKVGSSPTDTMYILDGGGCCGDSHGLNFFYRDDKVHAWFRVPGIGLTKVSMLVERNEWHFVTATWASDGTAWIFLDGCEMASNEVDPSEPAASNPVTDNIEIGRPSNLNEGNALDGCLDELRVYYVRKSNDFIRFLYISYYK